MVLPIHDVNPVRRTPVVTYLLIAVNVVAFLLSPVAFTAVSGGAEETAQCGVLEFFDRYAAQPDEITSNRQEGEAANGRAGSEPGTCEVVSPPPFDKVPVLSVLTAMFLHGGWAHLLGNMLFLYVFGNNVEDRLGRLKFLLFYLGCGYAATYGFALFDRTSTTPLVGASGAIAGVLGAYLMMFPRAKVWSLLTFFFFLPVRLPAWLVLGGWFVLQYLYFQGAGVNDASGVAYGAHVVGFVVGLLLALGHRGQGVDRRIADPRFGPYARR
ncbi:MAG: Rhomboid family protein [Frankiales bacterium]|nr:Rhomboid family protein [Frankiales bacterium]